MKIVKSAVAGTLESSDIFISVEPDQENLTVDINSVVENQYYEAISGTIYEVLKAHKVQTGKISINDRGALDCVIRARLETALKRGGAEQ